MNERLKFSWGHIIAFIGLIAASYFTFVGFTYLTNGDFIKGLILMCVTDFLFILFFIGAQQMKASGVKIRRKIVWERIFFFGAPIVFIGAMIGMSHFWTVQNKNDEVVKTFTSSINNAKALFEDYEAYSNDRLSKYAQHLDTIIAKAQSDPTTFENAGFDTDKANVQRQNMVEVLRLQLFSQNFTDLKYEALTWIDNSNQGSSTWNVFILGNTRQIKNAIAGWEKQLKEFTAEKMSNEDILEPVPEFHSSGAKNAIDGINSLTDTFTNWKFPNWKAILFGIVLYIFLIFPYFLQERHSKSWYRLIGKQASSDSQRKKPESMDNDSNSGYHSF